MNYYNECDTKAAAWLRELIKQNLIPNGHVDERSIVDVRGSDLEGYTQCHFFAGIGGWPLALHLAGWPEDRPVWTGSCPCPPFSSAGKKKQCPKCGGKPIPHPRKTGVFACIECGHEWYADGRHLWPEFSRLIEDGNPSVIFGEQVAPADGRIWLAGIRAVLEGLGYAVGAADLCAAGIGAPHIRQRLFWVANAESCGCEQFEQFVRDHPEAYRWEKGHHSGARGLEDANRVRRDAWMPGAGSCTTALLAGQSGEDSLLGDTECEGREGQSQSMLGTGSPSNWSKFDILECRDGKSRRIEPGLAPLAHGVPARVVRLRGYGNAIVPPLAAEFIKAYLDVNAL